MRPFSKPGFKKKNRVLNPVSENIFLQDFLFKSLPDLKKTKIKQILKFGSVHVNGREVTWYQHPLKPGDQIEILSKDKAVAKQSKKKLGVDIVYEDNDLLVVNKPAGLLTMGTEREKEKTLYFMLTDYVRGKGTGLGKQSRPAPGQKRVFIVHRLDREASGLVVFAKNEKTKRALQDHWDLAIKKYYAITEGMPKQKSGTIENFLREDDFKRVYAVSKNHPDAQHAVTHYRVLGENGGYTLLEVMLETGRKNQIRVHLAGIGCPIMGDEKYGAKSDPFRRLALHAYFLSFPHPATGELKTFQTDLPFSFKKNFSIFEGL